MTGSKETYVVVDVETTGLHAGRDRVTEVGIVLLKEGEQVETWTRLVNPGRLIPERISLLTGITGTLIEREPGFDELAEELDELTRDCILVGHHVAFDYSFLKSEMNRSGFSFSRKTVCTAELAKYLFPELRSYSLAYLCRYFGIVNEHPHRALPDAQATALLFLKLSTHSQAPDLHKLLTGKTALQFLPDHIRKTIRNDIPMEPGIYFFLDKRGKPLYIGKASNLRTRVQSHFRGEGNSLKILAMAAKIHDIRVMLAGSELLASLMEDHEIRHYWPPWNDVQKKPNIRYGIAVYRDMAGRGRLAIMHGVKFTRPLRQFYQYHQAAGFIRQLVKSYNLFGPWCGVPDMDESNPTRHERNFKRMIRELEKEQEVEIYFTEGRGENEQGFIWIENGSYMGIGFVPCLETPDPDLLEELLIPRYASVTTSSILSRLREERSPDLVFQRKKVTDKK